MHSAFDPYDGGQFNKFVDNIIQAIQRNGYIVHPIKNALSFSKEAREIKIIHLNWFESLKKGSRLQQFYYFIKKVAILFFLFITGKKIIWTVHNRRSHDSVNPMYEQIITYLLIHLSYRIMILSNMTKLLIGKDNDKIIAKIKYVPHPNFIGDYGCRQVTSSQKKLKLLFLGEIRAYKNIELLIRVVEKFSQEEVELVIAGKPASAEYKQALLKLGEDKSNIQFRFGFVENNQIPSFLSQCDLVVLPLDVNSSLNSGSAILSFSYGKTVICPEIGTIQDISEQYKEFVLSYKYTTAEEHYDCLFQCIDKAIQLKKQDMDIFEHWGNRMLQEVLINNSKEKTQQALLELYK